MDGETAFNTPRLAFRNAQNVHLALSLPNSVNRPHAAINPEPHVISWIVIVSPREWLTPVLIPIPILILILILVLILVLVLGVSASSLNLRVATSIPKRKMARWRLNCEAMPCKSLGRQSEERSNGDVGVAKQRQACSKSAVTTIRITASSMSVRATKATNGNSEIPGRSTPVAPLRLTDD